MKSQMPFADNSRPVSMFLEQHRDGEHVFCDEWVRATREDTRLQARSPGIATSQQAITGRSAICSATVGIGKSHALIGNPVNARCGNGKVRIEAAGFAVTLIIGHNVDDVGVIRHGHVHQKKVGPKKKPERDKFQETHDANFHINAFIKR